MDEQLRFCARVEVALPSLPGRRALIFGSVAMSLAIVLWGILTGRYITLSLIVLTVYGLLSLENMGAARTVVSTDAIAMSRGTQFVLRLPGTKLYQDRYINQTYLSEFADMDGVGYAQGKMMIRSRLITSVGSDNVRVVSNVNLKMCELSMFVEPEEWENLKSFFARHGVKTFEQTTL
jgi:hypothetical protein